MHAIVSTIARGLPVPARSPPGFTCVKLRFVLYSQGLLCERKVVWPCMTGHTYKSNLNFLVIDGLWVIA